MDLWIMKNNLLGRRCKFLSNICTRHSKEHSITGLVVFTIALLFEWIFAVEPIS